MLTRRLGIGRFLSSVAAAGVFLFVANGASAQRLFAVTEAVPASGDPVAAFLHSIEFSLGQVLPGAIVLPGTACAGPPQYLDGGLIAASTGQVTLCRPSPFEAATIMPEFSLSGWQVRLACHSMEPRTGDILLATLASRVNAVAAREDRAMVFRYTPGGTAPIAEDPATVWTLPGEPVGAVNYAGTRAAVLCKNGLGLGAIVVTIGLLAEEGPVQEIVLESGSDTSGLTASGISVTEDGQWLLAAVSGYQLRGGSAEPVSRLYTTSAQSPGSLHSAIDLQGVLEPAPDRLLTGTDGVCWAITGAPGTEFAHITRVRVASNGVMAKEKEYALVPGTNAPHIALKPNSEDVAAAMGRRLEIWPGGDRTGVSCEFTNPLSAVLWCGEGLFAAEANAVHQVDPDTAHPTATVSLQSGRVRYLAHVEQNALPAEDRDADGITDSAETRAGTSRDNPDSDGDGINDGVDPEPLTPSPSLALPLKITFHGRAVGQEIRAIAIPHGPGGASRWRIEYDEESMDWLVVTPRAGRTGEPCYLAINPARYRRGEPARGALTFYLDGMRPGKQAHGSPARVMVDVAATPEGPRRAVWIIDGRLGGLETLADMLSTAPFHFSIVQPEKLFLESLEKYELVVMDAQSADRGVVSRQVLLDYVAHGGALLLLGQHFRDSRPQRLSHLFAPLGFTIDPSVLVAPEPDEQVVLDAPAALVESSLARYWPSPRIEAGCSLNAPAPYALVVEQPNPANALAVARGYGHGRVLALAAPTPFQDPVLRGPGRRFAEASLTWLARAGIEIADMDGDGLPDGLEDSNDNGTWDRGETDYLRADTDGDGIPDGVEDQNRNGLVDDGETDPRNADSDSDGVWDAADPSPCPTVGAPYVVAVESLLGAAEGPSEGGTTVRVLGRNFTQDCGIWFGGQRAVGTIQSTETATAISPPSSREEGETVPVRVLPPGESPGVFAEVSTGSDFRYTPRSRVRLLLEPLETANMGAAPVSGELLVLFEAPDGVRARQVLLTLRPEPAGALDIQSVPDAQSGDAITPRVLVTKTGSDNLLVYTPQGLAPFSSCLLGRVAWRLNEGTSLEEVRLVCEGAIVASLTGVPLNTSCRAAVTLTPGATAAPMRATDGENESHP